MVKLFTLISLVYKLDNTQSDEGYEFYNFSNLESVVN